MSLDSSGITINGPTLLTGPFICPGRSYRACADGADAVLKEPRLDHTDDDTANWLAVHGSPILNGSEAPEVYPMSQVVEVSASSYPFVFNIHPIQP